MLLSFDALAVGFILVAIFAEAVRLALWVGQEAEMTPQAIAQVTEKPAEA